MFSSIQAEGVTPLKSAQYSVLGSLAVCWVRARPRVVWAFVVATSVQIVLVCEVKEMLTSEWAAVFCNFRSVKAYRAIMWVEDDAKGVRVKELGELHFLRACNCRDIVRVRDS